MGDFAGLSGDFKEVIDSYEEKITVIHGLTLADEMIDQCAAGESGTMLHETYEIIDGILDCHPEYWNPFQSRLKRWGEIYRKTDEYKRAMEKLRNFNY